MLTALELLRRVFDAVAAAGRRPEDFFGRAAESLRGATPRAYLEGSPLVNGEARLAVRDALREFLAAVTPREEPETVQEVSEQAAKEPEAEQNPQEASAEQTAEVPNPRLPAVARETEQAEPQPQPVTKTEPEPEPEKAMPGARARDAVRPDRVPQTTADWDKARTLTEPPLGGEWPGSPSTRCSPSGTRNFRSCSARPPRTAWYEPPGSGERSTAPWSRPLKCSRRSATPSNAGR